MPKVKSKKSASKRFRIRPGGSIKRSKAYMRHILTKKSTKRKRQLRGNLVDGGRIASKYVLQLSSA